MNIKRQRGRGRGKPTNHNPNRAYESTGPDIKVRGSAQTILEKYQQAGRDAMASGDRVLAENYMQHAEHYLRLLKSIQPHFVPRSELAVSGLPSDNDEELENTDGDIDANEPHDEVEASEGRENNRNWRNNDRNNDRNNNRYERRNNNNNNRRDKYRNRNQDVEATDDNEHAHSEDTRQHSERPQNEYPADVNENITNNDENIEATDGDDEKPRRRNTRLRSPLGRRPRTRRSENDGNGDEESAGFGDNAPAFLSVTPSAADA